MKIGIDARLYGTKNRGIGRYVKKLVDGLLAIDKKNDYVIFLAKENFDHLPDDNPRVKKILADVRWYSLKEQFLLPKLIKKAGLDIIYFPHFNVPCLIKIPYLLTIHDLIISHFPSSRATTLPKPLYSVKLLAYRFIVRRAIRRAKKIVTPSEFVKQDIISQYPGVNAEKIFSVYEGYFLATDHPIGDISRFNISKSFLLYVGSAYPHKNLDRLVSAFKKINQNKKYQLVLVGPLDYFYEQLKNRIGNIKDIIFTGYVSESELSALYSKASLYVFPSLHEGFGLPPIEAQAHDLPVACSDKASLPEVLGKGAVYFDPFSVNEMASAIKSLLTDKKLQSDLVALGRNNIQRFSWKKMAEEILQLIVK